MAPIIATKLGKVKGDVVELKDGKKVDAFRNIPFAQPPVGSLRFKAPEPAKPWEGVRDGQKPGNMPIYNIEYEEAMSKVFPTTVDDAEKICDEDCLHLSIYTPAARDGKNLPVMVWFYGGGFSMGSERDYGGTVLAGMNDVIVVVPNYRVGVFGFLSLGKNSVCPGNAGLQDQQLALRWVQDNIGAFGGDKNNVTIFGESAGAASVHLQVLSPTSKGLFHHAISHSGQAQLAGMFQSEGHIDHIKKILLKTFDIGGKKDEDILKALQEIPAKKLLDECSKLITENVFFIPSVDGKVLPKPVVEMLKDIKNVPKIPYIIGCNSSEGDGLLSMFGEGDFTKGLTYDQAKARLSIPITDEGHKKLKEFYLREEDGETKFSKLLGRAMRDGLIVASAVESAICHADAGVDVFCYLGDFQFKMHHDEKYSGGVMQKPDWCRCDHGDDIYLTFGAPFSPVKFTNDIKFSEDEKKLSKEFMTYLTNFAKTGDPNKGQPVKFQWPKYNRAREHLVVDTTFSVKKNYALKEMKFWTSTMDKHIKRM